MLKIETGRNFFSGKLNAFRQAIGKTTVVAGIKFGRIDELDDRSKAIKAIINFYDQNKYMPVVSTLVTIAANTTGCKKEEVQALFPEGIEKACIDAGLPAPSEPYKMAKA